MWSALRVMNVWTVRDFYPIGPQKVRMSLPPGRRVTRVELLRAETTVPFAQRAASIEFTIPKVVDYEVAALHSALRPA